MEALSKIIDLFKSIAPFLVGLFVARQNNKIDKLESENEKLKEFKKIDDKDIQINEVYDAKVWR